MLMSPCEKYLMSASELTNRKERVQVRENVGFPIRTRPKDCAKKINFALTLLASALSFLFSLCPLTGFVS